MTHPQTERIITQAPESGADEPAIKMARTLNDYRRRNCFRGAVCRELNRYEYSPHRFWNTKMDTVRVSLRKLLNELESCEYDAMRGADVAVRAAKVADLLLTAKRAIAVLNGAPDEPTAPPPRDITVRHRRDVETESQLVAHLKAKGVNPKTAFETVTAPASTRVAPSRVVDSWTKQNKRLRAVMKEAGVSECRQERIEFASAYVGRRIESFKELSADEVGRIADAVHRGDVTCSWEWNEAVAA